MRKILVPVLCGLLATFGFAQEKEKDARLEARKAFEAGQEAAQEENWDAAVAAFRKATEADPKMPGAWHMLGYSLHAQGKLDEALRIHLKAAEFKEVAPTATYNVACVYALKGDKDKAIEWLGKAMEVGFARASHVESDSDFDSVRGEPRFKELVKKMAALEASGGGGGAPQVYAPVTVRRSARVALFGNRGSPGQLAVDYGPVKWKSKYDELVGSTKTAGKAWRFGSDFWTTLDNNVPVTIGGTSIPAGYWYLTLTNVEGTKFTLGVHDANEVKKQKLDAFQAGAVKGGIQVPLEYEKVEDVADELTIKCDMASAKEGVLAIHFGGHKLSSKLQLQLDQ